MLLYMYRRKAGVCMLIVIEKRLEFVCHTRKAGVCVFYRRKAE